MRSFGEKVNGYSIPVLNEREVRGAAGIFLILIFASMQRIIYTWDFTVLKYVITLFVMDFSIRVFISPRFSPTLIVSRFIVRNQTPEYVGAEQKKFAWTIGVVLGFTMFISLNILNIHSPITGLICMLCFFFLLFESVFGICLGCLMYPYIMRKKPQYCPGEVCEPHQKQPIQFLSRYQILFFVIFVSLFAFCIPLLKNQYSQEPILKLGMERPK